MTEYQARLLSVWASVSIYAIEAALIIRFLIERDYL